MATEKRRIIPTCSICGSDEVSVDVSAYWDADIQEWVLSEINTNNSYCSVCEATGFTLDFA